MRKSCCRVNLVLIACYVFCFEDGFILMGPWNGHKAILDSFIDDFCKSKGWSSHELEYLRRCTDFSAQKLDALAEAISAIIPETRNDIGLFACGSFGRLEARPKSDLDLLMIINGKWKEPKRIRELCTILKKCCQAIERVHRGSFKPKDIKEITSTTFSRRYVEERMGGETFRRWFPESMLLKNQFDQNDTLQRQIRRVSLLLESQPLTANAFSLGFRARLLKSVYGIDANARNLPHELWEPFMHEVFRFLHSSRLFHHHKVLVENKPVEPRYQKLCLTRRMLGIATFLLMLKHKQKGTFRSSLCDPPFCKLIEVIEAETKEDSRPSSLEILTCYANGLQDIQSLDTDIAAGQIVHIQSNQSAITRTNFGRHDELLHQNIKQYIEEYLKRSGNDRMCDLLRVWM